MLWQQKSRYIACVTAALLVGCSSQNEISSDQSDSSAVVDSTDTAQQTDTEPTDSSAADLVAQDTSDALSSDAAEDPILTDRTQLDRDSDGALDRRQDSELHNVDQPDASAELDTPVDSGPDVISEFDIPSDPDITTDPVDGQDPVLDQDLESDTPDLADEDVRPPIDCPESDWEVQFQDRTDEVGLAPWSTRGQPLGAVVVLDVNGDIYPDLFSPSDGEVAHLYINQGSWTFVEATEGSGIEDIALGEFAAARDFDNDGITDLFVSAGWRDYIFLGDGEGHFEDVSSEWGLGASVASREALAVADFDGNGWLDVYESRGTVPVSTTGKADRIFFNQDGYFTAQLLDAMGHPKAAAAVDWDRDGWVDLFIGNDFGWILEGNALLRNLGEADEEGDWRFENVASEWDVAQELASMSATVADFDNDGDLDAYVTNMCDNLLLVSEDGVAVDRAREFGVNAGYFSDPDPPEPEPNWPEVDEGRTLFFETYCRDRGPDDWVLTSWASVFADFDQDGWQELFVANGNLGHSYGYPDGTAQPNLLFRNRCGQAFEPVVSEWPDLRAPSRGAVVADFDVDGDLDLVWVEAGHGSDRGLRFLSNESVAGNWLKLELEATSTHPSAIGTSVTLASGSIEQYRQLDGGQGYLGQHEAIVHFGLADVTAADTITIRWPSGRTQVLEGVDANQTLRLVEPAVE